ncbi:MAG: response regulator [Bilifractor sp.]
MIKLLIVDDENLTRTGLTSSIDWLHLGIDEVYVAEDGLDGLHQASLHKPEIILSDVRMPRMSGIEMMNRIHTLKPDTIFIFMSGYSDKEYLKAAIRLQAVNYVEKPLDIQEVEDTVRSAIARWHAVEQARNAESITESISAAHLALCLTMPYSSSRESVDDLSRRYCKRYGSVDLFHAAFTILLQTDEKEELSPDFLPDLQNVLHDFARQLHLHVIAAEKKPNLFVFHLFRKTSFSENTVKTVIAFLSGHISVKNWYIAAGQIVTGIQKLYDSYSSAAVRLQTSFFYNKGTALLKDPAKPVSVREDPEKIYDALLAALKNPERDTLEQLQERLYLSIYENPVLIRGNIQNMYYHLLDAVFAQRRSRQLPGSGISSGFENILDTLNHCFSYPELHAMLKSALAKYLDDLEHYVPVNSSVYLIKTYIGQHYNNPMLSTKEISEYASLSASYACTVFKNETGQTLNQYLTEYRLERAKELLEDPRNNISDIAARVGYNDSNYFGKAFKKYTGQSPSDYRESRNSS